MSTKSAARVLVVDDEDGIRRMLRLCLEGAGYSVALASSGEAAVAMAKKSPPDLALVDLRLGQMDGLGVLTALGNEVPSATVVLMTAYATIDNAVDAMRKGAADYLPKPFTPAQVLHVVGRALEGKKLRAELAELKGATSFRVRPRLATKSPAFREAIEVIERAAPTDATVVLLGETGTGKGVLARHLHALSPRRDRPFVTFNCAVVSSTLVENELFGHARGAFTGADAARIGHVEAAANGTLFLDEVGDLPREAQGKLLRLLEEHEYVRVGDTEPRRTEARVLSATHHNLRAAVASGAFREDLYYRLNVVAVRVPSLRERREDIADLAESIAGDLARSHRRETVALTREFVAALEGHSWPGNLRELVNVIERALILAPTNELRSDLLTGELRAHASAPPGTEAVQTLEALERRAIQSALATHPTLESAARTLGIDPSTLYRKRERYGLK